MATVSTPPQLSSTSFAADDAAAAAPIATSMDMSDIKMLTSLMPHQKTAIDWMKACEEKQGGGILADDMGLGKTMTCITLMVETHGQRQQQRSDHAGPTQPTLTVPPVSTRSQAQLQSQAPNLVICPKSLLGQWRDEIMAHTNVPFERILIYHGKRRQKKRRHHQQWLQSRQQLGMFRESHRPPPDAVASALSASMSGRHELSPDHMVSDGTASVTASQSSASSPDDHTASSLFFVVIMTYDTVRSEHEQYLKQQKKRGSLPHAASDAATPGQGDGSVPVAKSFLFDTVWRRILLDEAHLIRVKDTKISRAVMALHADRRWCVTGTPYNNSVTDVASLCAFVRIAPYHSMHWWNKHGSDEKAIAQWRTDCLLRRNKTILDLPPVENVVIECPLDPRERQFYDYLFQLAVQKYAQFQTSHQRNKLQMFGTMLSYLLRLRQACDHPLVVLGRGYTRALSSLSLSSASAIENTQADQGCVGCGPGADGAALAELDCGHRICYACARDMQQQQQQQQHGHKVPCADDSDAMQVDDGDDEKGEDHDHDNSKVITAMDHDVGMVAAMSCCALCHRASYWKQALITPPGGSMPSIASFTSTKLRRMLECIAEARRRNPTSKIVVFSQWTTAMDVIENAITTAGYGVVRYDGDVSNIDKRNHYVRMFKDDPQKHVFLGSLQAGGLGLNLAVADTVIMFDSWYNPFVEDQAVDRVHRLGQKNPVRIIRFQTPNTVEDDVLRIQQRKRHGADTLFSEKRWTSPAALESHALTEDDVHSIFKPNQGQVCRFYSAITSAAAAAAAETSTGSSSSSIDDANVSTQQHQHPLQNGGGNTTKDSVSAAAVPAQQQSVIKKTRTTTTTTTTTTTIFTNTTSSWSLWDDNDAAAAGPNVEEIVLKYTSSRAAPVAASKKKTTTHTVDSTRVPAKKVLKTTTSTVTNAIDASSTARGTMTTQAPPNKKRKRARVESDDDDYQGDNVAPEPPHTKSRPAGERSQVKNNKKQNRGDASKTKRVKLD